MLLLKVQWCVGPVLQRSNRVLILILNITALTIVQIKQFFPSSGSDITQPHACEDFTWKDYAPMVFRSGTKHRC
jgi:hypothetical protein